MPSGGYGPAVLHGPKGATISACACARASAAAALAASRAAALAATALATTALAAPTAATAVAAPAAWRSALAASFSAARPSNRALPSNTATMLDQLYGRAALFLCAPAKAARAQGKQHHGQ